MREDRGQPLGAEGGGRQPDRRRGLGLRPPSARSGLVREPACTGNPASRPAGESPSPRGTRPVPGPTRSPGKWGRRAVPQGGETRNQGSAKLQRHVAAGPGPAPSEPTVQTRRPRPGGGRCGGQTQRRLPTEAGGGTCNPGTSARPGIEPESMRPGESFQPDYPKRRNNYVEGNDRIPSSAQVVLHGGAGNKGDRNHLGRGPSWPFTEPASRVIAQRGPLARARPRRATYGAKVTLFPSGRRRAWG